MRNNLFFENIDRRVDTTLSQDNSKHLAYTIQSVALASIGVLFVLCLAQLFSFTGSLPLRKIRKDVLKVAAAVEHFEQQCGVADITKGEHSLLFLENHHYKPSHARGITVLHPEKWEGPYFTVFPRLQGSAYQLLKTDNGAYIIPGRNVRLSDGRVIGKDILFSLDDDLHSLREKLGAFNQQYGLIRQIHTGCSDKRDGQHQQNLSDMFTEFSDAFVFAHAPRGTKQA